MTVKKKKEKSRVTVNVSPDVRDKVKRYTEKTGQKIEWFFNTAALEKLEREKTLTS
jgi:hypothetical protein